MTLTRSNSTSSFRFESGFHTRMSSWSKRSKWNNTFEVIFYRMWEGGVVHVQSLGDDIFHYGRCSRVLHWSFRFQPVIRIIGGKWDSCEMTPEVCYKPRCRRVLLLGRWKSESFLGTRQGPERKHWALTHRQITIDSGREGKRCFWVTQL